ncbi:MAG TPA: hypothetical protein ENI64_04620 [Gammaproteobacteria bacterium]|nr:hypothetical protein [Gammaproteobacteria bacterium]
MRGIYIDPESKVVGEHCAVVYVPRKGRNRFPENCVDIMSDEHEALHASRPEEKYYAARVMGPSRSSEGLRLYYLVAWL